MEQQSFRWGAVSARWAVAILFLGVFMAAAASWGNQTPKGIEPPEHVPPEPVVSDYRNDPLFQEIQRMMLKGSGKRSDGTQAKSLDATQSTAPSSAGTGRQIDEARMESLSDARWHAIETMLSASRVLETDRHACAQQGDLAGAAKIKEVMRTIRSQAVELLLER